MFLEERQGWVEVGGFSEPASGAGVVGVAAGELLVAGAVDPVEEPAGVVDAGVGAHQVERGQGVVRQVAGQPDRTREGVGGDGAGPAVAASRRTTHCTGCTWPGYRPRDPTASWN